MQAAGGFATSRVRDKDLEDFRSIASCQIERHLGPMPALNVTHLNDQQANKSRVAGIESMGAGDGYAPEMKAICLADRRNFLKISRRRPPPDIGDMAFSEGCEFADIMADTFQIRTGRTFIKVEHTRKSCRRRCYRQEQSQESCAHFHRRSIPWSDPSDDRASH